MPGVQSVSHCTDFLLSSGSKVGEYADGSWIPLFRVALAHFIKSLGDILNCPIFVKTT